MFKVYLPMGILHYTRDRCGDLINTVLGWYDYRKIIPLASRQHDQGIFYVSIDSSFEDLMEVLEDKATRRLIIYDWRY